MNKIFRAISISLIFSMSVISFTGCSSKTSTASSSEATSTSATGSKDVSFRFAWWGGDTRHKATLAAIDAYMKKNPNVKIEGEYMGYDGYEKKLVTQVAGGTAPDLFQDVPAWFSDITTDNFVDLNKKSKIIDLSNFNKALIDEATYNNKLQGLPGGVLSTTMLYNKDFFKKFNIPEDANITWDKLLEIGKMVHDKDKSSYLVTGDLDVINRLYLLPYLSQKTGDIWVKDDYTMAFDKANLTEALKYISDLFTTGTMEPLGSSTAFIGKMEQNPKWIKSNIGMIMNFTSSISTLKAANTTSQFGVMGIPMRTDAKESANPIRSSVGFSINANSPVIDEVAKFLNWLLNDPEAAAILGTERGTPGSAASLKVLVDSKKIDPLISSAMDISGKNPGKAPNAITENTEISQINKDVISQIAYGKTTPEKGADTIIKGYETKLKELQSAKK